jgi:hypothetical protein
MATTSDEAFRLLSSLKAEAEKVAAAESAMLKQCIDMTQT